MTFEGILFKVLAISDACTNFIMLCFLPDGATAEQTSLIFVLEWLLLFGLPSQVVWTDMGPEFLGVFRQTLETLGVFKGFGAAYQSQSKSKIETRLRPVRYALDRALKEFDGTMSRQDIPLYLRVASNDLNNSLIAGAAGCASQRAFGQHTSLFCVNTEKATTQVELLNKIFAFRSAFQNILAKAQLSRLIRFQPPLHDNLILKRGDLVLFLRGKEWRGPATVSCATPNSDGTSIAYYILDHGGTTVHVSRYHIKMYKQVEDRDKEVHDLSFSDRAADPSLDQFSGAFPRAPPSVPLVSESPVPSPLPKSRSPDTTPRGIPLKISRGDPQRSPAPRRAAKRRSSSAPVHSTPGCRGCRNVKHRHDPGCSKSRDYEPTPGEVQAKFWDRAKKRQLAKENRAAAEAAAAAMSPPRSPSASPPATPPATRAKARASSQPIKKSNIVPFVKGATVSFLDYQNKRHIATVDKVAGTKITLDENGKKFTSHPSNLRHVRAVRTAAGDIFTSFTVNTSEENADAVLLSRVKEHYGPARVVESEFEKEFVCLYTKLETEYEMEDSTCDSSDDESHEESSPVSQAIPTAHDRALFDKINDTVGKKFLKPSDADGINFESLPQCLQSEAYDKAIAEILKRCSKEKFVLKDLKVLRRKMQRAQIAGDGDQIVITLFDFTVVIKVTVDESRNCEFFQGLRGKIRLTPRGFREHGITKREAGSPTAHPISFNIAEFYGLRNGFCKYKVDFHGAFFAHRVKIDCHKKRLFIVLPKFLQDGAESDARSCRELEYEIPGNKLTALHWFLTISSLLVKFGFRQSKCDPCFFIYFLAGRCACTIVLHVDDSIIWCQAHIATQLKDFFVLEDIKVRLFQKIENGESNEILGMSSLLTDEGTYQHQAPFIQNKLLPVDLDNVDRREQFFYENSPTHKAFQSTQGNLIWLTKTRYDVLYDVSVLASGMVGGCSREQCVRSNILVDQIKKSATQAIFYPRFPSKGKIKIVPIADASHAGRPGKPMPPGEEQAPQGSGGSQGGAVVGIMMDEPSDNADLFFPLYKYSIKLRRTTGSSFDAECINTLQAAEFALIISWQLFEVEVGPLPTTLEQRLVNILFNHKIEAPVISVEPHMDALDIILRTESVKKPIDLAKRRMLDIEGFKQMLRAGELKKFVHIRGTTNPVDPLTKALPPLCVQRVRLFQLLSKGKYIADLIAPGEKAKKRALLAFQSPAQNDLQVFCAMLGIE